MKILDSHFNYLKADFYSAIFREILNCYMTEQYMSSLIVTICCVDYMGIPLSEKMENTRDTFKKFLGQYMSEANSKYKDEDIQKIIYAIRCSLVHSFG